MSKKGNRSLGATAIILLGAGRSGKGSVARMLKEDAGFTVLRIADAIRAVVAMFHPEQPTMGALQEGPTKERYRGDLQDVGNFLRKQWPGCLTEYLARNMVSGWGFTIGDHFVIEDARFYAECDELRGHLEKEGFHVEVWGVERPASERPALGGNEDDLTERDVQHLDPSRLDALIANDGTLDDLYLKVSDLCRALWFRGISEKLEARFRERAQAGGTDGNGPAVATGNVQEMKR